MNEECNKGHPPAAKGKQPAARGIPPFVTDRGHPPEIEYGAFQRVKLPEIGMVCAGNRDIKQVSQSHQLKIKKGSEA